MRDGLYQDMSAKLTTCLVLMHTIFFSPHFYIRPRILPCVPKLQEFLNAAVGYSRTSLKLANIGSQATTSPNIARHSQASGHVPGLHFVTTSRS
jgi:hypothetical protein